MITYTGPLISLAQENRDDNKSSTQINGVVELNM